MAKCVQLVGGPRDGQWVEDCGPVYREPVRRAVAVSYVPQSTPLPVQASYDIREYHREVWSGDLKPRYVLETTDLGQRSFHPREEI
jgi:hypothetical protein